LRPTRPTGASHAANCSRRSAGDGNCRMAVTGWAGVTAPNPKEAVQWIAGHTELEQGERAVNCDRCRQVRLVTLVRLTPTLRKIWSRLSGL
jgi:hypothetical protein